MLEVFNFICQLAPAAHEFQISLFGFWVLGFLRRNGTFDGFDPEPFRPCRHRRQRATISDVPVVGAPRGGRMSAFGTKGRLSMRCNKTRARTVETDLSNGGFLIMGRNSTSDVTQAERELEETRGLVQQQFGIVKRLKRLDADTKERSVC
jgi:hypothetical protein